MTLKDITPEEELTLMKEFKHRVKGLLNEEMYADANLFQRFLRARNYDIDAAEQMLRKHMNWRKLFKVDTILKDYTLSEVFHELPVHHLGHDKEGMPVVYVGIGNVDVKGLIRCAPKMDIMKFAISWLETGLDKMKKQRAMGEKDINKWLYIYDFENFSVIDSTTKQSLDLLISLILMYDNNYPELLKTAFFINVNVYITAFYNTYKQFAAKRTIQKIKLFGKEGFQEELLELIDADVLPAFLGGDRTDPDGNPRCRSFIKAGGTLPERVFDNSATRISGRPGVSKMDVSRKSKEVLELVVGDPGSRLEWEFQTEDKDIGFALFYKPNKSSDCPTIELLSMQRIDTRLLAESGVHHCDKSGVYIIEFNNTYSWTHNKEVYYRVSVAGPQRQQIAEIPCNT